ncbi:MAG: hypothetical protein HRT47_06855 [Candidatus Caenarcaniphilales bacterium]|nr:hypothetical protein [Candidatus Caenarcaniphilales bacterium]
MVIPLALGAGYGTYLVIGGIVATTGVLAYNVNSLVAKNDSGFGNGDVDIFKPEANKEEKSKNKVWEKASGESKLEENNPPHKPDHNCQDFGSIENLKKKGIEILEFHLESYPAALFAEQTEKLAKGVIDREKYIENLINKAGFDKETAEKFTDAMLSKIKDNQHDIGDFVYGLYNDKVAAEVMAGILTGFAEHKCPADVLVKYLANQIYSKWANPTFGIGDPAKQIAEEKVGA